MEKIAVNKRINTNVPGKYSKNDSVEFCAAANAGAGRHCTRHAKGRTKTGPEQNPEQERLPDRSDNSIRLPDKSGPLAPSQRSNGRPGALNHTVRQADIGCGGLLMHEMLWVSIVF